MIKQFFTQPKVLSRLQEGVFGPYLPAFAASLHEEGYSRGCIRRHLRAADHFGVWLTNRRLTVGDLTRATLDRYIEGRGRLYSASTPNGRLPHSAQGLHELLEFLKSTRGDSARRRDAVNQRGKMAGQIRLSSGSHFRLCSAKS